MANKTSTIVTRTLHMGVEDFNRDLARAVRVTIVEVLFAMLVSPVC